MLIAVEQDIAYMEWLRITELHIYLDLMLLGLLSQCNASGLYVVKCEVLVLPVAALRDDVLYNDS